MNIVTNNEWSRTAQIFRLSQGRVFSKWFTKRFRIRSKPAIDVLERGPNFFAPASSLRSLTN